MKTITLAAATLWAATRVFADTTTSEATSTSTGIEEASAAPTLNAQVVQGCFSSAGDLVLNSTQLYNSKSKCALDICKAMNYAVAGTTGGNECYCGDKYPPEDTLANDTDCNVGCTGYDLQACGGVGYWTIYNTGLTLEVEYSEDASSSSSASGSSATATSSSAATVVTVQGGSTVVVTATNAAVSSTSSSSSSSSSKSSTNVAGIAAGVVVGVVVVAGILGAVFFVMRRRRNREIEEEHRRNAAVNAFINGSKPPGSSGGMSITDARLDPVMAQRRMSDGSIADNQDYSRRILRVTNA